MTSTLRWGIMATGWIANEFVEDLLLDPTARNTHDVRHEVVVVASSGSVDKAQNFVSKLNMSASTKAYGSYEQLVADGGVDIIYVATPQSRHYGDVLLALNAGKHVLCEKPFTINAAQAIQLVNKAKEKNLFLMEAAWTRFFPHTKALIKEIHEEQRVGPIRRVFSDFSIRVTDRKHRLHKPELGGGALLDLGFYPLTWAFLVLYNHPENAKTPPKVDASVVKSVEGVDEYTSVTLTFEKLNAVAHLTTSLCASSVSPYSTTIQGDKGDIVMTGVPPNPHGYTVRPQNSDPIEGTIIRAGHGLIWQADECARAIRDGKVGCAESTLEDTVALMKVMDEVRRQGNFVFPSPLEDV